MEFTLLTPILVPVINKANLSFKKIFDFVEDVKQNKSLKAFLPIGMVLVLLIRVVEIQTSHKEGFFTLSQQEMSR